jgi:uncharacterized protein (DUF302 family)
MKSIIQNKYFWLVAGFVGGMFVTNLGVVLTVRNVIVREYKSPLNFQMTVDKIVQNAEAQGWSVAKTSEPTVVKVADRAVGSFQVLELSQPDYAMEALKFGPNRCVAMTPYTVTVYEEQGQVYVSFVNNGVIGRFFRRQAQRSMTKVRADEDKIFAFLAKR